jgi:hypothetical protein
MSETLDTVRENLLGKMEYPIPRVQLNELMMNRVHVELTSDQMEDVAVILTSDLTVL